MNTEKVFIGYIKKENGEFEEKLLYKKGDNCYIDLLDKNKKEYDKTFIDETKLIPYSTIKNRKYMLSSSVKSSYKKDRQQNINPSLVYYGPLREITNIIEEDYGDVSGDFYRYLLTAGTTKRFIIKPLYLSLFERVNNREYKNLLNNKVIPEYSTIKFDNIQKGTLCVCYENFKSLGEILYHNKFVYAQISKKEIMEAFQKIEFDRVKKLTK